jgi:hypothetical protein
VEEATDPALDVSLAAKNVGDKEVQNSLPSTSHLTLIITLILNNHFPFHTGIGSPEQSQECRDGRRSRRGRSHQALPRCIPGCQESR